jgi:hypothetical protein
MIANLACDKLLIHLFRGGTLEYFYRIDLTKEPSDEDSKTTIQKGKIMKISPDFEMIMTVTERDFIL